MLWSRQFWVYLFLHHLRKVEDVPPHPCPWWEQAAPLLGLHLHVPHLHLARRHDRPKREDAHCSQGQSCQKPGNASRLSLKVQEGEKAFKKGGKAFKKKLPRKGDFF